MNNNAQLKVGLKKNDDTTTAVAEIPERFHHRLTQALKTLKSAEFGLAGAERARGKGSVGVGAVVAELRPQVEAAYSVLAQVHVVAERNGVDFIAALEPLGGLPDLARFDLPYVACLPSSDTSSVQGEVRS